MTTIVVVDDEIVVADSLAFFLGAVGYVVHIAHCGAEALELIGRVCPDLVITDCMMPTMSGLDLALALKATGSLSHIPLVLASATQGSHVESRPDLFAAILSKPYPPEVLLSTLSLILASAN